MDPVALERARVAVLMGGLSSEREVSLESGRCILEALRQSDGRGPLETVAVEWRADGRFAIGSERVAPPTALGLLASFDAVFIALHGGAGEDGTLQGGLDLAGAAYTGSGVAASALAMDKPRSKAIAAAAGVHGAPGEVVFRQSYANRSNAVLDRLAPLVEGGAFLKPPGGGSSVAMTRLRAGQSLRAPLEAALAMSDQVLVEAAVEGLEVTCAVLHIDGRARVLPVVEILPAPGQFFNFDQKYAAEGAVEHCPPATLDAAAQREIERRALAVHRAFGCRGLTRTDFIVREPDRGAACDPVFLELNTLPGFTPRSLAPLSAAVEGLSYRDLCLLLLKDALWDRVGG